MIYKLFDEPGLYRDKDTLESKNLLEASIAYTPEGINVGWVSFDTLEEALNFYNLELAPIEELE